MLFVFVIHGCVRGYFDIARGSMESCPSTRGRRGRVWRWRLSRDIFGLLRRGVLEFLVGAILRRELYDGQYTQIEWNMKIAKWTTMNGWIKIHQGTFKRMFLGRYGALSHWTCFSPRGEQWDGMEIWSHHCRYVARLLLCGKFVLNICYCNGFDSFTKCDFEIC